jgi:hypothetical protein
MRFLEVVETCFATKFKRSDPATKEIEGSDQHIRNHLESQSQN